MPRISAPTVAEHRERRRADLLEAAAALIRRGHTFTVAEVANEVGLSRSAVYEYYSSAADLIADVMVDELADWVDVLRSATLVNTTPMGKVEGWISAVLSYVIDGRHALLRAAGSIELPATRRAQVHTMHAELMSPLVDALNALGDIDPSQLARYVWGVVEASIERIESGACEPTDEIDAVLDFIRGGLAHSFATRN